VVAEPGAQPSYSGGGYVIAQLAIEDHTGRPLEEMADTLVFVPLGLELSTYRILDASDRSRVAVGYRPEGAEVAGGGWHAYPETAPASLWTTPTEYAAFVVDVMRSYTEGTGVVLDRATARQLLDRDFAVGFGISGEGIMGAIAIGHDGANEGYRCEFAAVPDPGDGVIVMTNSDAGGTDSVQLSDGVLPLTSSVIDAVAQELAWPRTSWWMPILAVAAVGLVGLATLLGWLVIRRRRRTRSPRAS
jgi:CubicO group peptidase (beta-lactamase class C family)